MNQLNHITVALSGTNLIEASAGTGKTYAIASLYLRLLVEQELLPEQILVVTYTEAATQELRSRIRTRIREALEVMEGGDTQDAFLEELYEKASQGGMKRCAISLSGLSAPSIPLRFSPFMASACGHCRITPLRAVRFTIPNW